MARRKKPRNNCSTVDDIMVENERKEKQRRTKIAKGMREYRAIERMIKEPIIVAINDKLEEIEDKMDRWEAMKKTIKPSKK